MAANLRAAAANLPTVASDNEINPLGASLGACCRMAYLTIAPYDRDGTLGSGGNSSV